MERKVINLISLLKFVCNVEKSLGWKVFKKKNFFNGFIVGKYYVIYFEGFYFVFVI